MIPPDESPNAPQQPTEPAHPPQSDVVSAPEQPGLEETPPPARDYPQFPEPGLFATALYTVFGVLGLAFMLGLAYYGEKLDSVTHPHRTLDHIMGRDLDASDYIAQLSSGERALIEAIGSRHDETLRLAIGAYTELFLETEKPDSSASIDKTGAAQTLAILLAENGQLNALPRERLLDPLLVGREFTTLFSFAYEDVEIEEDIDLEQTVELIEPAWARDRFLLRIAAKIGSKEIASGARSRIETRGEKLYQQTLPLLYALVVILLLGAAALLLWLARGRRELVLAQGFKRSPWSVALGYAILIRAETIGLLIAIILSLLPERVPVLYGMTTLLASLPVFLFASHFLALPVREVALNIFGVLVPRANTWRLLQFTAMIAALNLLGTLLIGMFCARMGWHSHWTESTPEEFLNKSWSIVALLTLDAVLWAPIFEELIFRGFLFVTLRRAMPVLPAALLSATLFAIVHGYSIPGLLAVGWSGFVWALSYEKSQSLLPGMIDHSLNNVIAVSAMLLAYRV